MERMTEILGKLSDKEICKKLMHLCAQEGYPIKEFTAYHKISSKNPDSVKNAVNNFKYLANKFDLYAPTHDENGKSIFLPHVIRTEEFIRNPWADDWMYK